MYKQELKQQFTSHWNYLTIYAGCKLQLFDKLFARQHSLESLVTQYNWNRNALMAMLDIFYQENLIEGQAPIALTPKGELLISSNREGLYYACLLWAEEHMQAWLEMSTVIETGLPSFERIYKEPFFDYLSHERPKLLAYHEAMREYAIDDYKDIAAHLDLGQTKSILDVGGGLGALIENIHASNPIIQCGLMDLPEVLQSAQVTGITLHPGNFFEYIPQQYDAMVMSRVLHDWDDNHAQQILANAYEALPEKGTLFILENLTNRMLDKGSGLTLNMMAMCKSFERSEDEYENLLNQAGFVISEIKPLTQNQYIIKAHKS